MNHRQRHDRCQARKSRSYSIAQLPRLLRWQKRKVKYPMFHVKHSQSIVINYSVNSQ